MSIDCYNNFSAYQCDVQTANNTPLNLYVVDNKIRVRTTEKFNNSHYSTISCMLIEWYNGGAPSRCGDGGGDL